MQNNETQKVSTNDIDNLPPSYNEVMLYNDEEEDQIFSRETQINHVNFMQRNDLVNDEIQPFYSNPDFNYENFIRYNNIRPSTSFSPNITEKNSDLNEVPPLYDSIYTNPGQTKNYIESECDQGKLTLNQENCVENINQFSLYKHISKVTNEERVQNNVSRAKANLSNLPVISSKEIDTNSNCNSLLYSPLSRIQNNQTDSKKSIFCVTMKRHSTESDDYQELYFSIMILISSLVCFLVTEYNLFMIILFISTTNLYFILVASLCFLAIFAYEEDENIIMSKIFWYRVILNTLLVIISGLYLYYSYPKVLTSKYNKVIN